jgi:hypothetical protein
MKRLLIMLPVYGRQEIVKATYKGLEELITAFKPFGITADVLVIYSQQIDLDIIPDGFMTCWAANEPLGEKLNSGLRWAMDLCTFDYLMLWGCDNFMHRDGVELIAGHIDKGSRFFGFQDVVMYSPEYREAVKVRYPIPSGVGRCHTRQAIEQACKCYRVTAKHSLVGKFGSMGKGQIGYIPVQYWDEDIFEVLDNGCYHWHWWPEYSRHSTDMDSESRMMMVNINCTYIKSDNPYILDVKDKDSLSPWLDFRGNKQNEIVDVKVSDWIGLQYLGILGGGAG